MTCDRCHKMDTIEIEMHLQGKTVHFFSCRFCEAKWWKTEQEDLALDDVLSLAGKQ